MKLTTKHIINYSVLVVALTAVVIFGCRCSTFKQDPLVGFHAAYGKVDQSIVNDYQDYIKNLSPEEKRYMGSSQFFEDDTGQHAVRIEVDIDGKDCWYHVLVYDTQNKRVKLIKYFYGRYQS